MKLVQEQEARAPESRESAIFDVQVQVLGALGFRIDRDCRLLDYGCDDGWLVRSYRGQGIQAYGCDVELPDSPACRQLEAAGVLGRMPGEPPRVPFADGMFDVVTSNMVFEHVPDYDAAFAELHRVLKPGGRMLHVFAPRFSLLEQHSFVPFAGVIRCYWWLYFWAALGIRNGYQRSCSAAQTARRNWHYLRAQTYYLTKRQIKRRAGRYFDDIAFREDVYLRFSPQGRKLPRALPSRLLGALYSATRARVLVASKPPGRRKG